MINKIEILSPGEGCRRTQRIVNYIIGFLDKNNIKYELQIISNPDLFHNYKTWILPTVIINNKIISRGYKPTKQTILKNINK